MIVNFLIKIFIKNKLYILIFFPKLSKTSKKLKIMDTLVMIFDTETSGFLNSGGRLI